MTPEDRAKAAVLRVLRAGQLPVSEAARRAGVSRRAVYQWCAAEGIDWRAAWQARMDRDYLRAVEGRRRKKPTKAELRAWLLKKMDEAGFKGP